MLLWVWDNDLLIEVQKFPFFTFFLVGGVIIKFLSLLLIIKEFLLYIAKAHNQMFIIIRIIVCISQKKKKE